MCEHRFVSVPISNTFERLVLMGFMGSGKTTVGRILATTLEWAFADLDALVEERCGRTVPQIFAEQGEAHFRVEESNVLRAVMGSSDVVIALGGGAIEHTANQLLLQSSVRTAVIYLEASFGQIQERCFAQASHPNATLRPLLSDLPAAQRRFEFRLPIYEQTATLRVDTTDRSPSEVAAAILHQLL